MASKHVLYSNTISEEKLNLQFTAGTSGAVPASFTRSNDIDSVTKSTNDYLVKLLRGRTALTDWSIKVKQATYNASTGACSGNVTVDDVAGTTKTATVSFYNAAGTAVALATGDVVRITLWAKNSAGLI